MRRFVLFNRSTAALGAAVLSFSCTDASLDDGGSDGPGLSGPIECAADDSTWQGIQKVIFDGYGCTNGACHGHPNDPAGGLDLDPAVAYQNLIRVNARANLSEPKPLVFPGEQSLSFLYEKVAAGTRGNELPEGGGDPMPLDVSPLSADHLEALRLWIRSGAPETGIVEGTSDLLECGLSNEFTANKVPAPPAPAVGEGLQFVSGPWPVSPGTEDEVCFATYYDLTQTPELVPEEFRLACPTTQLTGKDCWAYNFDQLTQDAQSHHSIISVYHGDTPTSDPAWGEWKCNTGDFEGMSCDPAQVTVSAANGGGDCGQLAACASTVTSSFACVGWGPADQRSNRVGMGGAQSPVSGTMNPDGVYSVLPMKGVIVWNSHAFNLTEQETTVEQYNNFWFAGPSERIHIRRGIFDAKDIFVANVPPFEQRTYCSTYTMPQHANLMRLGSHAHKRGWLWQTWLPPNSPNCRVENDCQPRSDEPEYTSRIYNDPVTLSYDPPLEFHDADADSRTLQFCVTYDNGKEDRTLVKRNSTSVGSSCVGDAYCYGGPNEGMACGSDDSVCGEGGVCDACVVVGGATTEDEMFILLGSYYVAE